MRLVAVVALVCGLTWAGTMQAAEAKRVVMRPSIHMSCSGPTTWARTAACIERFGKHKVLRQTRDARVVRVAPTRDDLGVGGIYLFVRTSEGWRLGGSMAGPYQFVDWSQPTYDGHKVFRIDLAYAERQESDSSGTMSRQWWMTTRWSMFCEGDSPHCMLAMTSCDYVVHGKTINRFRGTLVYAKNGEMQIVGDRTLAGDMCVAEERVFLPVRDE